MKNKINKGECKLLTKVRDVTITNLTNTPINLHVEHKLGPGQYINKTLNIEQSINIKTKGRHPLSLIGNIFIRQSENGIISIIMETEE